MEHHNSAHQSGNSQKEEANNLATSSPLYEVTKMKYQDLLIKIFSDSFLENNPRHFFFEPLVLLDPKSIVDKSPKSLKLAFIQFTIQMWNDELRVKVLERLRSLKSLQDVLIEEDDVCVLPFEEVQLVCKSGAIPESTRLTNEPTSYLRSKEKLDFYLLCDEPSLVNALAEDFRQNPEFTVSSWQLKLECRGLSSNSTLIKKPPTFSFNVSILPNEVTCLTNPNSAEPRYLLSPKQEIIRVTQDVVQQFEATSSTIETTSTPSPTTEKRKRNKRSTTGLAMLTTALRSVSTAASGRGKVSVAKAALVNLELHRKRSDATPSSSSAPKQRKSGQNKQLDQLKVEIKSAEKEASTSIQENLVPDEEDAILIVRPRRSGRLPKVPALTTDSCPIIGEESNGESVLKTVTVPKSSSIRKRIKSEKAVRTSSGSKPSPLPSSRSESTTSTLPKSSSTPTSSRAEIKKKVLSPLSFIRGSRRKGDNTPWKPMDEVNKLFFGPHVRLVKLDHPPSLSTTRAKLKRNIHRATKATPNSTGKGGTKTNSTSPLLNPEGSNDPCCSALVESTTSKSNGSTSSSSTDPHCSRAEMSTTGGGGPILIFNPTSQGALRKQDQIEALSPLSPAWNSSQTAGDSQTDLIPSGFTCDTTMEGSNGVVRFGGTSLPSSGGSSPSTGLPSFAKVFGKKMEGYFDSIRSSYSSTLPLSIKTSNGYYDGSMVTDHTLGASSSTHYLAAGERTFKIQTLLEGAMAKELGDQKDVDANTFFARVRQGNQKLVKTEISVDSLLQPKAKVTSSHLLKDIIVTTQCSSFASTTSPTVPRQQLLVASSSSQQILVPLNTPPNGPEEDIYSTTARYTLFRENGTLTMGQSSGKSTMDESLLNKGVMEELGPKDQSIPPFKESFCRQTRLPSEAGLGGEKNTADSPLYRF